MMVSDQAMPGSTDVGDVSWVAPTAQISVACYPQGIPPHSWQFVAIKEHKATLGGEVYESPIPPEVKPH